MDLTALLAATPDEQFDLFGAHVNAQLVKVLRTIGFDKQYVRASGAYLYDRDGAQYLDCLAGYGVFNMGRNHPRIKAALKDALDRDLPNMVQMDAPLLAGRLARALLDVVNVPHIDTIFFTNSGTEAVEAAIKMARGATRRPRIVYCDHAFHGLSNGALSCNGNAEFRDGFAPLLPHCDAIPFGDLAALEQALAQNDVAAFIVEPIQGKGVYIAPAAYFDDAIRLCRRHGTLFVADEVQTGLGRTGTWFAFQHWQEAPDMVCVAKALSGGFVPAGGLCYPRAVYQKVFHSMDRCVVHSNTFGRNTLAMVAGLATLTVLAEEQLIANAARQGQALLTGLRALAERYEMVDAVRGEGLMIGIAFGRPRSFRLRTGWDLLHKLNDGLFGQLIVVPLLSKHRILTQVAGHPPKDGRGNAVVKLLPSLTLSADDVQWLLAAFDDVLAACHTFPGSAWEVGKDLAKRAMRA